MILNSLLVAAAYYIISWCQLAIGVFHLNRPIIVSSIIGLILGDLRTGIILGATFEAVFLGAIAVGGSVPADATIGATIGTAIAIITGADANTALAITVPVALLGVVLFQLNISVIIPLFIPIVDKYAEEGNIKAVSKMHWLISFLMPLLQTMAVFLAVWLGSDAIASILESIPVFVTKGFQAAGSMLPAVGFALLLNILFDKKLFAFYFLGFALSIYLKLPSLAIAIIAIVLAINQYLNLQRNISFNAENSASYGTANIEKEDDFFNE